MSIVSLGFCSDYEACNLQGYRSMIHFGKLKTRMMDKMEYVKSWNCIYHPCFLFIIYTNSFQRGASNMPGWLWDTVSQYPLSTGDTRTQYSDGSTYVGPLKDGMRHGNGAYFFQDGSQCVKLPDYSILLIPVSKCCRWVCFVHFYLYQFLCVFVFQVVQVYKSL